MKKSTALCLIIFLAAILSPIIHHHPTQAQTVPSWTIMVYMAADNDIESFALADLNEMEFVGSTAAVNVVVQLDRSPLYDTRQDNWSGARRFLVAQDTRLDHIGSQQLSDLGSVDSGDPVTLVDFTTWAMTTYPADHYALVIWDHGGSWLGVATDGTADDDDISLVELESALQQITQQTGIPQLDIIGFDACLMGSLEVYEAIAPYAIYAVGSPELMPGSGWDYMGMLDALTADPTMDGLALGKAIVDSFVSYYKDTDYDVFGIGLVDLARSEDVAQSLQDFATIVEDDPVTAAPLINQARGQTLLFGAFDDPRFVDFWAAADLLQFMQLLTEQSPTSEIGQAAEKVIEAGARMIVYYRTSSDEENSGGMSIYFPRNQELYGLDDHGTRYDEEAPTDLHSWRSFLKTFYSGLTLVYSSTTQGSVGDITAGKDGIAIALNFGSGEVSQAAVLVVLEVTPGQVIIVDYSRPSEIKDNQLNWGGKIPWLTNGHSSTPVLVMPSRANRGIVNGVFYPQAGKPVEAQVIFDLTTNRAVSVWGLRQTDSSIMPFEIKPQPGDIFQPFWLSPGRSSSALVPIPANTQFVFGDEPFELDWRSAPAGSYRLIVLFDNSTDERLTTLTNGDDGLTITTLDPNNPDMDGDLIPNEIDNCPGAYNPSQIDTDGDGLGDECDPFGVEFDSDPDGDGIRSGDNCPALYNPDQADADHDGLGDACDFVSDACSLIYNSDPSAGCPAPTADTDQDGISDSQDNCPTVANANQADSDSDGMGDVCDSGDNGGTEGGSSDSDGDGILDGVDNCPTTANPDQLDADSDRIGNVCDYTSPDIPEITVSSISRLAASPTSAATVTYSVAFSEAVSGLSTSNFTVVAPNLTGAAITGISGSDTTYTITVNVGSGDGALTLQMVDSTGVTGALGRPVSNVPFMGETYTIDKTPPMVSSIALVNTNPTNAATVSFTITYSEAVVGLTAANFALNTSGLSGTPAITSLIGSGASYTVTASTGSGNGWLGLNMVSTTGVADAAGNPFANLPFVGPTYTVDRTAPWVTSISLLDPTPTNAATVRYQVQFSEPVTGVAGSNFVLFSMGLSSTSISVVDGSNATYEITANTGSGDGSLRLDLYAPAGITDLAGNMLSGTLTGSTYTMDRTAPTVISIVRAGATPTNATSVGYNVSFSEAVTGVAAGNFTLVGLSGPSITQINGSGANYAVTVNTGTGDGTLQLNLTTPSGITDLAGNTLSNTLTGAAYTVDKTAPQVVSILHSSSIPEPTKVASLVYQVTFSESVSAPTSANFTVAGPTGAAVTGISGSGTTYNVTVSTGTADRVTLTFRMTSSTGVRDAAGNTVSNLPVAGPSHTIDNVGPSLVLIAYTGTANPTNASTIEYEIRFTEPPSVMLGSYFTLSTTGSFTTAPSITSFWTYGTWAYNSFYARINTGAGDGTITLALTNPSGITDQLGNPTTTTGTGNTVTIDKTAPTVDNIAYTGSMPTYASTVTYRVTFSEAITGIGPGNFTPTIISGTFTTLPTVTAFGTATMSLWNVTVDRGGTDDGTIRLDLTSPSGITDLAGNALTNTLTGDSCVIDRPPSISFVGLYDGSPVLNIGAVRYEIMFTEPIFGLSPSNFSLSTTLTGASVTSVNQLGGPDYLITISFDPSQAGTLTLSMANSAGVTDSRAQTVTSLPYTCPTYQITYP